MPQRKRRIRVTPERKRKPDYRKMAAALQDYLAAQAEVDAAADAKRKSGPADRGTQ